jgi:hypothetical protein
MSRGHVYEHIRLLTESGREVEIPFLELDEELWDREMKRLTLFIDPGRIKREVRPLEEIGPALVAGKRFALVIDRAPFRKEFRVGPPDRQPPDPAAWKIDAPRAGTRESLTIAFGESLDHALAHRLITLHDSMGAEISGKVDLAKHDERWMFTPDQNWVGGTYSLKIGGILEDLAGNSVGRPFEVDIFEGVERKLPREFVTLPVQIQ